MKNKVDTVICLRIRKTYTAKTSLGDFKITTPENSLLSQQAVTSKGISVPYANLQLNLYPNTQLDLFLFFLFFLLQWFVASGAMVEVVEVAVVVVL